LFVAFSFLTLDVNSKTNVSVPNKSVPNKNAINIEVIANSVSFNNEQVQNKIFEYIMLVTKITMGIYQDILIKNIVEILISSLPNTEGIDLKSKKEELTKTLHAQINSMKNNEPTIPNSSKKEIVQALLDDVFKVSIMYISLILDLLNKEECGNVSPEAFEEIKTFLQKYASIFKIRITKSAEREAANMAAILQGQNPEENSNNDDQKYEQEISESIIQDMPRLIELVNKIITDNKLDMNKYYVKYNNTVLPLSEMLKVISTNINNPKLQKIFCNIIINIIIPHFFK